MPRKDRKFTEIHKACYRLGLIDSEQAIRAAYRRGKIEGRQEAEDAFQTKINNIINTHTQLLKEILRMDKAEPVTGVMITIEFAESIIKKLKSNNKYSRLARKLKKCMNTAGKDWEKSLVDIENELRGAEDE